MTYNQRVLLIGFVIGGVYGALRVYGVSGWILMPVAVAILFATDRLTRPR
jgi:hypothetical protein